MLIDTIIINLESNDAQESFTEEITRKTYFVHLCAL